MKVLDVHGRLVLAGIEGDMGSSVVHTCFITKVLDVHRRLVLAEV